MVSFDPRKRINMKRPPPKSGEYSGMSPTPLSPPPHCIAVYHRWAASRDGKFSAAFLQHTPKFLDICDACVPAPEGAMMSPYLRVNQRLHAEVVDSLGLHEVLHVELVRPSLSEVGQAEVEPLRVPVGVDIER